MAKIIDPDLLTYVLAVAGGAETQNIVVDVANKKIEIQKSGNLTDDGVTGQALYSKLKEIWKTDTTAIKYDFPMEAITPEQFEFIKGWELYQSTTDSTNSASENLIRDAGFLYRDVNNIETAYFMGFDSVFALDANTQVAGDQVYWELNTPNGTRGDAYITGQANQPIKIYGDGTHGNVDYTNNDLRFFVREEQKSSGFSSVSALNVPLPLTYKKYSFPISNGPDTNIGTAATTPIADTDIFNVTYQTPYDGMSITTYSTGQTRNISGNNYTFSVIINGNNATAEQIYAYVQYQLRQNADIDGDGTAVLRGEVTDQLLEFVGSDLYTRQIYIENGANTGDKGVYIDNFNSNDTNRLYFTDDSNVVQQYDYVAAGTMVFNQNLIDDPASYYTMFYLNDDAGSNLGYDFGTSNAIIVTDSLAAEIKGDLHATVYTPTTGAATGTSDGSASAGGFVMTSTAAGTTAWTVDDFNGHVLVITSGSNAGYYNITDTTTTTLTVDKAFEATDAAMNWEIRQRSDGNVTWDYAYDTNSDRGNVSPADAPIVIVAIGLNSAQYVRADGTIKKAVGQNFSLVSSLERNFRDPA